MRRRMGSRVENTAPICEHFVPTFPTSVIRSMWWYSPLESVTDGLTSSDMMVFPRGSLAWGS